MIISSAQEDRGPGSNEMQELRRSQLETQVGTISTEVRTEKLELGEPCLGWDCELKEEAARLKRKKMLVSGEQQRRETAQSRRKEKVTRRREGSLQEGQRGKKRAERGHWVPPGGRQGVSFL